MMAYCGLDCEKCEAFKATQNNDDALRAKVAADWSKMFNVQVKADDVNCTGCRSDGIKVFYCDRMCNVRKCAAKKSLDHCGQCESYPCDYLNEIFSYSEVPKANLEALRQGKC